MRNHNPSNWLMNVVVGAAVSVAACSPPEPIVPSGPNLEAAKGAANSVHAMLDLHGKPLDNLLAKLEGGLPLPDALTATMAATRAELPEHAPIVVYAAKQRFVASDALPDGPPMTRYLIPAVRRAMASGQSFVTDLWIDQAKHPWVTLVRVRGTGDKQLAAATVLRVDGAHLQAQLEALPRGGTKEVQVLDGAGMALWSSNKEQRFKSAVHGTYLVDQVRLGAPVQTRCHSCHEGPDKKVQREDIVVTAVPVPGSAWSVVLH